MFNRHALCSIIAFLVTCYFVQSASAQNLSTGEISEMGIHKCKLKDGSIAYQQTPCHAGSDITVNNWNHSLGAPKKYTGAKITLTFKNTKLGRPLQLIASLSGSELYIDNSSEIDTEIAVIDEPWDELLYNLDIKYHLTTKFYRGKMFVQRHP